jgi:hypothetical protein
MKLPFKDIANRCNVSSCGHVRNESRTCTAYSAITATNSQELVDNLELRARMKDLFELILKHCQSVDIEREYNLEQDL